MSSRAFAAEREPEKDGAKDAGANLTTDQQAATIQKWADWILKQREAARIARTATVRSRPSA